MNASDVAKAAESANNILLGVLDRFFPYCGLDKRALDIYIAEIEKSDKPKEFKAWEIMQAKKEFKKLKNINSIFEFAQEFCSEDEFKNVHYSDNEDWYDYFLEHAGNVSEEEVQRIWGQILANEIKKKGSTPRSVISILSEIDSQIAQAFVTLCNQRLIVVALDKNESVIQESTLNEVMIFDDNGYYSRKGLDLLTVNELESIGLISTNSLGYSKHLVSASKVLISDGIFTDCVLLNNNTLIVGGVMLTRAGLYLSNIVDQSYAHDQRDVMKEYYSRYGYKVEETSKKIVIDGNKIRVVDEKQQ